MRIKLLLLCILSVFLIACESKAPIKLTDGKIIDNCKNYNIAREKYKLVEALRNMSVASEYLDCSLSFIESKSRKSDNTKVLQRIYNNLKAYKIPLSISRNLEKNTTFKDLNWELDLKSNKIVNREDNTNIAIFLKGELSEGYLIWVIDEILHSTYRAYFPAIVLIKGSDIEVKPLYKSGY